MELLRQPDRPDTGRFDLAVEKTVRRFADAGATELLIFSVGPPEDEARTVALFAHLAKQHVR